MTTALTTVSDIVTAFELGLITEVERDVQINEIASRGRAITNLVDSDAA